MESVAVPPLAGVAASASVHCCTNEGVTVDAVAVTTNVSGFAVEPPVHVANRYPADGAALSVTLRPHAPLSVPLVIVAVPPVAAPIVKAQVGAGAAKVAVTATGPVCMRTVQSAAVPLHKPPHPAKVLLPVVAAVRVTPVFLE